MGDYELHFAEEGRAPFGLRLRLPADWTHKTTKDLVAHFVEAHDKANPPLVGAYGLVDVRTGRFYADDASLADVELSSHATTCTLVPRSAWLCRLG